ncbi:DNA mismatch repair endonuclease MutL [Tissierella sp. MB52-C2]|uniref:DNA mismatch repair endonuclease MutL n=1 Tax=Tissierella sp. MB52-C2 TaxID=3070999 RepID=UPI00280BF466|nr:DNA mismatch repair endonuclease MutL [Tissierella sp. MB52-C2]WMM26516.1 DNA mismatch repair endonuclease MutL [Tissierella sp. MB52-C2]
MSKIKVLDNITIQKIAAGEVIERPASIVKELIENSLDANADHITIEIKNGGKTYIRVTDNGDGIAGDDLSLAFMRHSTSKLSTAEDLYRIKSLGFRGEALASISHVSRVEVMTKTEDALGGINAIIEEGKILSQESIGCPKGTTMIVKDLFYNIPVRKEFLKSDLAESNQISDIVYKVALGNPKTSFKFIRDNRVVLNTSKNNNMESHVYSILGKDFSSNLTKIDFEDEGIHVYGYISNNKLYRSNRSHQYIYVNGRYVSNKSLSNVIENHYRSTIPLNRFPCFIIFMDLDPGSIDVNIHPTKQEIKFANEAEIIEVVNKGIKEVLYPSLSIPSMSLKNNMEVDKKQDTPTLLVVDSDLGIDTNIIVKDFTNKIIYEEKNEPRIIESNLFEDNEIISYEPIKEEEVYNEKASDIKDILSKIRPIGIVFNTYILSVDDLNQSLYFIDQHAAHERVMYEKYLEEFGTENIVTQNLLAPEIIDLTNMEKINVMENLDIFRDLGFDVEEFGNNSIAIRAVPLVFGMPRIKDLFYEILDNINNVKSNYDTKLEKIMKIACTKAVKGGDHMNNIEINSLIKQLKLCDNPHSCPHGRPTVLEMTKKDIEKSFLRII